MPVWSSVFQIKIIKSLAALMHYSPAFVKLNYIAFESCKSKSYSILTLSSCNSSWNRQDATENGTLETGTSLPKVLPRCSTGIARLRNDAGNSSEIFKCSVYWICIRGFGIWVISMLQSSGPVSFFHCTHSLYSCFVLCCGPLMLLLVKPSFCSKFDCNWVQLWLFVTVTRGRLINHLCLKLLFFSYHYYSSFQDAKVLLRTHLRFLWTVLACEWVTKISLD